MKIIHRILQFVGCVAALAAVVAGMAFDSHSAMPLVIVAGSMVYALFYFIVWKEVLRMAVSPIKELRSLIFRGVRSITLDYRRIPKCWQIVIEEELIDAGYKIARISGPVRIWTA